MSSETTQLDGSMRQWLHQNSIRESQTMADLRTATQKLEDGLMITSQEQLQLLAFLATSIGAVRTIEVGVFTGSSALVIAQVLPEDGVVVACDLTDEYLAIAQPAWVASGVADKIDMRVGPALDTLQSLIDDGQAETFDFMYIDADKVNSKNYYELGLALLRSGGIITIDNMFYSGQVADDAFDDESTIATRQLAAHLHQDERVDYSLIPIGDGLAVARKRGTH